MKKVSILGATGSIGIQTLDVIRKSENDLKLIAEELKMFTQKKPKPIEKSNTNESTINSAKPLIKELVCGNCVFK